jgi:hypothetical protein
MRLPAVRTTYGIPLPSPEGPGESIVERPSRLRLAARLDDVAPQGEMPTGQGKTPEYDLGEAGGSKCVSQLPLGVRAASP